jgi:DNA-binding PadR family transcriptional regulator
MFADSTESQKRCDPQGFAHERAQARRHRHRQGGFWGVGGFPFGGFPPGGPGYGRGRKARRGDIRTAALLLLAEEPRNGYEIIQEVERRSEGVWRPSAGSIYPALAQLEDEGLIRSEERDGRKLFVLTDAGRELVSQRGAEEPAPWQQMTGHVSEEAKELGRTMRGVAQVMSNGDREQIAKARAILDQARRDLYRILADGEGAGEGTIVEEDA